MPQYYTLEEAAKVLRIPADQLRDKAKKKEVRAFQDRGNWRFLAQQIDELARQSGLGSDADLQLGEAKGKPPQDDRLAVDFDLDDDSVPLGKEKAADKGSRGSKSGPRSPKPNPDSDVRLALDNDMDFQIELDSDVKAEPAGPKGGPKSSGSKSRTGDRKSKFVDDSGVRLVEKPSDSDVKVVPAGDSGPHKKPKPESDSDIRLQDASGSGPRKKGGNAGPITEEIDLDAEEAREAARSKAQPARKPLTKASSSGLLPTVSPFELSESDLGLDGPSSSKNAAKPAKKKKSDLDSSSDFELIPFDASKSPAADDDAVSLGDLPGPTAGNSGINLQDPADSGISLESDGSDEIEFELTLDSGATPKPSAPKPSTPKPAKKKLEDDDSSSEFELTLDESPSDPSDSEFELSLDESDDSVSLKASDESSDSEFELTLDDEGGLAGGEGSEDGNDIFEDTNFDVPALDEDESGSQAVALDESDTDLEESDFEISLDDDSGEGESGSQVVALDDEEEAEAGAATIAKPRKTKSKSKVAAAAEEEEPGLDFDPNASGEAAAPEEGAEAEEESEEELAAVGAAPPAEWGVLPVVLLAPTVLVMFLVSLMGFELVQGMWGYHRPAKVGRPIIDTIARQFDETLPKD
jgi:excisionase family DNA binding protein